MPSDCCYFVDKAAAVGAAPALYYFGSILHCISVFTQNLGQTPFLPSVVVFCCVSGVKEQPVVYLEHSKADREASHGLAVDFFGVLFAMKLFSRNNGFQVFFFAASSIAF